MAVSLREDPATAVDANALTGRAPIAAARRDRHAPRQDGDRRVVSVGAGVTKSKETAQKVQVTIIGAGVVGCALAYEFSLRAIDVLVLEGESRIADGTTSRNSGVVHAGLYYPPGSLKAESCVRGSRLLYEWCAQRGVAHRKTGKWIVGSKDEESELADLLQNGLTCGAIGVAWGDPAGLKAELPGVRAEIGLFSAETGIVDPYEYARSLQIAAEQNGALVLTDARVHGLVALAGGGYRLETTRGAVDAELVINAAGLFADDVARLAGVDKYRIHPCRGDYFRLRDARRYESLVYPVKKRGSAGLGVHLTLGLDGSYRLGPDVEWVTSKTDYAPPAKVQTKLEAFCAAAGAYLEGIGVEQLSYDSCGLRPKLRSPTDSEERDFVISEDAPGLVNLVGIESPGLTAARDLAQRVVNRLVGALPPG